MPIRKPGPMQCKLVVIITCDKAIAHGVWICLNLSWCVIGKVSQNGYIVSKVCEL